MSSEPKRTVKHVILLIPGILNVPWRLDGWTDDFVTLTNAHTPFKAQSFEYMAGPLTRLFRQQARADMITLKALEYIKADFRVHIVAHSNGCSIACRILRNSEIQIESLHLIASASWRDFDANGLNEALMLDRIETVFLYGSDNDWSLKLGGNTRFLHPIGLGYGTLGLHGPENLMHVLKGRVKRDWRNDYGHSTWLDDNHRAKTFRLITETDPFKL